MVDPVSLYSSENIFDGHTIQSWLIYGGGGGRDWLGYQPDGILHLKIIQSQQDNHIINT